MRISRYRIVILCVSDHAAAIPFLPIYSVVLNIWNAVVVVLRKSVRIIVSKPITEKSYILNFIQIITIL